MRYNKANLKKFKRALSSLESSTDITVELKKERWEVSGRNSPYASHCFFNLDVGHGIPHLIKISNNRYSMVVAKELNLGEDTLFQGEVAVTAVEGRCCIVKYPGFVLTRIFDNLEIPYPDWIFQSGGVWFIIPDDFVGYDEGGNPQFDEDCHKIKVTVSYQKGCDTVTYEYEI